MNLPAVDRAPTLADQVYQSLRVHLRDSSIRAGEPIQEAQVAAQMGVSRTPVREALSRLVNEGLLIQSRRSFVTPGLAAVGLDQDTPQPGQEKTE